MKNKSVQERLEMAKKHKGANVAGSRVNAKIKSKKSGAKFGKVNFNG